MSKWADFCISAVRYSSEHTHIVKVRAYDDRGDVLGSLAEWKRNQVVAAMENGESFVTIYQDANGKWKRGEDVHIITVNTVKYIRTDANHRAADNLGNLPEY